MRSVHENAFQLAPLAFPEDGSLLSAKEALAYTSIALFVRLAEESHQYEFIDPHAPVIAAICKQLDGLALAIELAVSRLSTSDPSLLLKLIEQSVSVLDLSGGPSTSRQQTLLATLAWSYRLLSKAEAWLFRQISVFAGAFSMDDLLEMMSGDRILPYDIANWAHSLAAKSLLATTYGPGGVRLRMLESTRSFATVELQANDEFHSAYSRYGNYLLSLVERAEVEWNYRDRKEWTSSYAPYVNDIHKSIDWAYSKGKMSLLGIRLTAAAVPLWG